MFCCVKVNNRVQNYYNRAKRGFLFVSCVHLFVSLARMVGVVGKKFWEIAGKDCL